jgi:hypothetical protein
MVIHDRPKAPKSTTTCRFDLSGGSAYQGPGGDIMRRTRLALLAGILLLPAFAAQAAAPHLGMYLKAYYIDYEIIKDCATRNQLSQKDVDTAKAALAKVEADYLRRDPGIKKDVLMKQAVSNKNTGFKMIYETGKVDLRQYCRASLNDLVGKLQDLETGSTPGKAKPGDQAKQ